MVHVSSPREAAISATVTGSTSVATRPIEFAIVSNPNAGATSARIDEECPIIILIHKLQYTGRVVGNRKKAIAEDVKRSCMGVEMEGEERKEKEEKENGGSHCDLGANLSVFN